MPSAENTVTIARPRDAVFAFLSNTENDSRWRPGVLDIKRTSGEGVGSKYAQGVKGPFGRRIAADLEITDYRPNEVIAFRTVSGPVRPDGRYELSDAGEGTRVRFVLDAELTGAKKLMSPMVAKSMRSEVGALDNLKRELERS
jgi:carbon monoxide dehydrogenase subunit G